MKKRRRLITVSAILIIIAVINFALLQYLDDGESGLIRGWRLFLTLILSIFLIRGNNSARWITVILTGLGALGGLMALALLFLSGALHATPALLLSWLIFLTVAYTALSAFLAFSEGIAREIRRIAQKTI